MVSASLELPEIHPDRVSAVARLELPVVMLEEPVREAHSADLGAIAEHQRRDTAHTAKLRTFFLTSAPPTELCVTMVARAPRHDKRNKAQGPRTGSRTTGGWFKDQLGGVPGPRERLGA